MIDRSELNRQSPLPVPRAILSEAAEEGAHELEDLVPDNGMGALVDAVPMLIWRTSVDGSAEFFNRRWLEYTGLSVAQARGWLWELAVHPDDQECLRDVWRISCQAGEADVRLKGADGRHRWFLFRYTPLRDEAGQIVGWCGASTDIDDRKQIEHDLVRSKAILDETQRVTHCGSMGLNFSTGEVFWSEEGARIFGFDPKDKPAVELIGQRIHPDDRWLMHRSIERAMAGEPEEEFDVRLILADGSIRYVRRIHPPGGTTKSPLGSICAVMDVTLAREADAALQEAQRELARVTRMASLGELASITHEIIQPLSAIKTTGEASVRWLDHRTPNLEEARQGLLRIITCADGAAEIVHRVRSMSKKAKPEHTTVDLSQMIQEVLLLVRGELVQHHVLLQLQMGDGLPSIRADRVQLQQVVINLLANGIQAMAAIESTRVLSLRTEWRVKDRRVLIEVEDHGSGIDPAVGDRLFEPFFTTKPEGMGMGLAICRSIIAAHRGRLWFSRGEGTTTFHVELPVE
jgi:PAS domain S-box-containing protein